MKTYLALPGVMAVALSMICPAMAGTQTGGKTIELRPVNNSYSFINDGARASAPACVTVANQWAINMSTNAGMGIAATIIGAFYNKSSVTLIGTGTCDVLPGVETVSYAIVYP